MQYSQKKRLDMWEVEQKIREFWTKPFGTAGECVAGVIGGLFFAIMISLAIYLR